MKWNKLFLVIFLLVVSCRGEDNSLYLPPDLPPDVNYDGSIELQVLAVDTDMPFGIAINLLIINRSNSDIWFPDNFGVAIYQQISASDWLLASNNVNYNPSDPSEGFFIVPYVDLPTAGSLVVSPSVSEENINLPIRIFVIGRKVSELRDITDELIGAYVDVTLLK